MTCKSDLPQKFLSQIERQLCNHLFLLFVFQFEFDFPYKLKKVIYSFSDISANIFQLHEVFKADDIIFMEDAPLSIGIDDLNDHFRYVRGQQHEKYHYEN